MDIPRFEELDYQETPLGELILRKRTVLSLGNKEVYEIILGNSFLMSSLFTKVEIELSHLGLAAAEKVFSGAGMLDVAVGGLGLGCTAVAALEHDSVKSLAVVDYLKPVIEWHQKGLVPLGEKLTGDARTSYVHGDFFELGVSDDGFEGGKKYHAILLDIDHSPDHLLHERHGGFYKTEGLRKFASHLHPGGVFGLWSDDPPEENFMKALGEVFESCEAHVVSFHNPIQEQDFESTVYVAKLPG